MSTRIAPRSSNSRAKIALLLLVGGMAGAMTIGAAAAATTDDEVPRLVVRYSEQSLATDSGARALYRQLVNAANRVCPELDVKNLAGFEVARSCRKQAIARAVQQVNNPRLAAVYASSSKNS
jgi:UrcA family protein